MPEREDTAQVYGDYYAAASGEAVRRLEEVAIGIDWGGNGYTTRAQAEEMADLLQLRPDATLADLGSGAGWPGIYLASLSGCDVVLSDLTAPGMASARRLARDKQVRARVAVASAIDNPFASDRFDAVSHSDLLC